MVSESNRKSAASNSYVDSVCRSWGWSWTPIPQTDDDGLDGLIYLRVKQVNKCKPGDRRSWKHEFTGGVIHVQIKTGGSYLKSKSFHQIEIAIADIEENRQIWQRNPLPVALVYVQDVPEGKVPTKAWWVDLKLNSIYTENGTVIIPLKNRFEPGIECRKPFAHLASGQINMLGLRQLDMAKASCLPNRLNHMGMSLKQAARAFYRQWAAYPVINERLGEIIVNRTGWAHMTRVGRPISRIQTSFDLLPAAARIVANVNDFRVLRRGASVRNYADGSWAVYDYLGLSAMVKWPARESTEVMVVLRRQTVFFDTEVAPAEQGIKMLSRRIWFYSVYEPGRRK